MWYIISKLIKILLQLRFELKLFLEISSLLPLTPQLGPYLTGLQEVLAPHFAKSLA